MSNFQFRPAQTLLRYTSSIILTLDAELEQRIQREIELGHGRNAVEVIHRALDLTADEEGFWTEQDKTNLDQSLDLAMAQAARGEVTSGRELREDYERRRAARAQ